MPCFDSISCNFTPNTFMRLQDLRRQWNTFESAYEQAQTNNGYYAYPTFQIKELVRQGQILHVKVFPQSNWVLPSPSQ